MRVWHALVALVAGGLIAGAADAADAPPPLAITSVAASLPQGQSPALHVELSDPSLDRTAIVEVQRVAATLPADLWTPPAAAWAVEIVPWGHHGIGMQASLRNATGHRLQLLGPGVLSQTRARGEKDVVATDLHPQV